MGSRLYNCKGLKTLHDSDANLRKICNLYKDKGKIVCFVALQGKSMVKAL